MTLRIATLLLSLLAAALPGQERDVVITGGWLFTSTGAERIRNPGIVIRAGKFLRVGGDLAVAAPNAERIAIADTETVIPGLFDLHAHYSVELFGAGRKDETAAYPSLFLANGVTSTFPAGEMDPNVMHDLRVRIENGAEPGPRLLNSGPYFGTARPGWDRDITAEQIYVVRGNPLADIRRTRLPRLVIKAGRVYDPQALMTSVEGKIGPMSAADTAAWAPTPRQRRGATAPSR